MSPLPSGGVYPRGHVKIFRPWSTHTDSSGEYAMDKVNEHPSGQEGGERDSDKNDRRKESRSWRSFEESSEEA